MAPSPSDLIRGRRCEVCGCILSLHRLARGVCEESGCQHAHARRLLRRERLRQDERQRLQEESRQCVAQIQQQQRLAEGTTARIGLPIVLVPANTRPLTELPEQRRRLFAEHLRAVAQPVFAEEEAPAPSAEASSPEPGEPTSAEQSSELTQFEVLGGLCATCGGRCCLEGGEHAYLDADSVRAYRVQHPQATLDSFVADYLSWIPQTTYQDSCVFHAEEGCALPREMRSEEARRYFCESLKDFIQQMRETGQRQCFAAAIQDREIVRTRRICREESEDECGNEED